ncbi:hypothetical protein BS47DRAFT_826301 [Hydnum rufescens UP504]|uniref:Zn(2)-C6 fungal-type domain-containing protein n=1 Tax=Hydnum rufescens UP504 TaxID=1448309 RepID=A0A9P6AZT6_9AGAM|nr:hypothetical protein BS47DRAFT_826301 [Hydnum rufescens UP504]
MLPTFEMSKPLRRGEACICCRQQKTKCDGLKPSCTQCLNMKRECGYTVHLSRLQKLEQTIKSLEDRIQTASSSFTSTGDNPLSSNGLGLNPPIVDRGCRGLAFATVSSTSTNFSVPQTLSHGADEIYSIQSLNHGLDVPVESRLQMLQIFIDHRSDFLVDIYLPRLHASMHLPLSHPDSLHPALLNAIFLAATLYCGPELQSSVSTFLQRTREGLRNSLAFADRLDDFFWASIILSWYYIRLGRMLEAYDTAESVHH